MVGRIEDEDLLVCQRQGGRIMKVPGPRSDYEKVDFHQADEEG
jgi:hypothetical protein